MQLFSNTISCNKKFELESSGVGLGMHSTTLSMNWSPSCRYRGLTPDGKIHQPTSKMNFSSSSCSNKMLSSVTRFKVFRKKKAHERR